MISDSLLKPIPPLKATALVVDDDADFNSALRFTLQSLGVSTACASNGTDAIGEFRRRTYDLVLLDLGLPDIDGIAVLEWIKARRRHTVVAIMTAYAVGPLVQRAKALHLDYFLGKPFPRSAVEQIVLRVDSGALHAGNNSHLTRMATEPTSR